MSTIQEQQTLVQKWRQKHHLIRPVTVRALQAKMSGRSPAPAGVWISQDVFTAPISSNLPDVFHRIVEDMTPSRVETTARNQVELCDVPLEWIGQCHENMAAPGQTRPSLSDEQIYHNLCGDVSSETTILYAHGGAFYAGSPTFSRGATTRLAKLTGGRIASIQYRLAPQDPFPTAILDLIMSWLSLIYPAEDARHTAVSPDKIVLAGDSAGGNLCLALVQVILRVQSLLKDNRILFNSKNVQLPMPAGVAVLSPYLDLSRTLPSELQNKHIDYLRDETPLLMPGYPPDDLWPSNPPRGDPYCHPSAWIHPLVCPTVAKIWSGAPPIWIAVGEERMADGSKILATEAARQGVQVIFFEYKGLPHVFPMILSKLPQSGQCFREWANACLRFCQKSTSNSQGIIVHMPGGEHEVFNPRELSVMGLEEAKLMMKAKADQQKPWVPEGTSAVKL